MEGDIVPLKICIIGSQLKPSLNSKQEDKAKRKQSHQFA